MAKSRKDIASRKLQTHENTVGELPMSLRKIPDTAKQTTDFKCSLNNLSSFTFLENPMNAFHDDP